MTDFRAVIEQLSAWPQPTLRGERVVVPTHCLYAGGAIVRVLVEGSASSFIVHDDAGAIDEFSSAGGQNPRATWALRSHFRDQGIIVNKSGALCSPIVEIDALAPTIALIANASREAEEFLHSRWKPRVRRNFKKLLKAMLETEFAHLKPDVRVVGSSQKQHTFDFAVDLQNGNLILLDAVSLDQNAISSAVMRNLDVRASERGELRQRIIYDDAEEWQAADLNLLKLGATPVPFSKAPAVLHRLAA